MDYDEREYELLESELEDFELELYPDVSEIGVGKKNKSLTVTNCIPTPIDWCMFTVIAIHDIVDLLHFIQSFIFNFWVTFVFDAL